MSEWFGVQISRSPERGTVIISVDNEGTRAQGRFLAQGHPSGLGYLSGNVGCLTSNPRMKPSGSRLGSHYCNIDVLNAVPVTVRVLSSPGAQSTLLTFTLNFVSAFRTVPGGCRQWVGHPGLKPGSDPEELTVQGGRKGPGSQLCICQAPKSVETATSPGIRKVAHVTLRVRRG